MIGWGCRMMVGPSIHDPSQPNPDTYQARWVAHMAAGWTANCRACHTAIGPDPWHLVWYPKCDGDTGWWPAHQACTEIGLCADVSVE